MLLIVPSIKADHGEDFPWRYCYKSWKTVASFCNFWKWSTFFPPNLWVQEKNEISESFCIFSFLLFIGSSSSTECYDFLVIFWCQAALANAKVTLPMPSSEKVGHDQTPAKSLKAIPNGDLHRTHWVLSWLITWSRALREENIPYSQNYFPLGLLQEHFGPSGWQRSLKDFYFSLLPFCPDWRLRNVNVAWIELFHLRNWPITTVTPQHWGQMSGNGHAAWSQGHIW